MSKDHLRSASSSSAPAKPEFEESFTSFPVKPNKDSDTDPNLISNIFSRFKTLRSVATNAVQQVLPGSPDWPAEDSSSTISHSSTAAPANHEQPTNSFFNSVNSSRQPSRNSSTSVNAHPTVHKNAYEEEDCKPKSQTKSRVSSAKHYNDLIGMLGLGVSIQFLTNCRCYKRQNNLAKDYLKFIDKAYYCVDDCNYPRGKTSSKLIFKRSTGTET